MRYLAALAILASSGCGRLAYEPRSPADAGADAAAPVDASELDASIPDAARDAGPPDGDVIDAPPDVDAGACTPLPTCRCRLTTSRLTETRSVSQHPDIVWNPAGEAAVVYEEESSTGALEMTLLRVTRTGGPIGLPVPLTRRPAPTSGATFGGVAFDGAVYGVAWIDDVSGTNAVHHRAVRDGIAVGPLPWLISPDGRAVGNVRPAIAADAAGFVIAWAEPGRPDVQLARIPPGGGAFVYASVPTLGPPSEPVLARHATGFALGYVESGDVRLAMLDPSLTVRGTVRAVTTGTDAIEPEIAVRGDDVALVWGETDGTIHAAFPELGRPVTPFRVEGAGGGGAWSPDIVATGALWAIAWFDDSLGNDEIRMSIRDVDGAALGDPIRVSDTPVFSYDPQLAWNGESHSVVWFEQPDDLEADVYYAVVDCR